MGNENFAQAINKVEATCGPEIEDKYGFHDVQKAGKNAESALVQASSWKDKLSGGNRVEFAAKGMQDLLKKEGAGACGKILKGLESAQTRGEFQVAAPTAVADAAPAAPKMTQKAESQAQTNPGLSGYASNGKLARDMAANGV